MAENQRLFLPLVKRKTGERVFSERGWRDYNAGLPFPLEYDTWSEPQQRNYEYGRMRAAAAPQFYDRVPLVQTSEVMRRIAIFGNGFAPPRKTQL